MATDICVRRLTKELKALQKDPITSPKITVMPMEDNILCMHYVIEGSADSPYAGGVYHGKLVFPKDYPLKPPSVLMLTPSGRFQPNRRLCLSMVRSTLLILSPLFVVVVVRVILCMIAPMLTLPLHSQLFLSLLVRYTYTYIHTYYGFVFHHSRTFIPKAGIPCGVLVPY